MVTARLTASRFGIALVCRAPFTRFKDAWDESTSPAAQLGKAFHKYAEHLGDLDAGELAAEYELDNGFSYRLLAMTQHWDEWAAQQDLRNRPHSREVKYAIDPVSLETIVPLSNGERDYSNVPPGWVPMTADLVLYDSRRVADYKSSDYAEPPEENAQMRLLALAVSKRHGWPAVRIDLEIFQAKGYVQQTGKQAAKDLARTAQELRAVTDLIRLGDRETVPGKQCRWCPARRACPDAEAF